MQTYYFTFLLIVATYVYVTYAAPRQAPNKNINYVNNKDYTLCITQDCLDVASKISAKLDRTVDPCDNFYQFACGGWMKDHPANMSYPLINSLRLIAKGTREKIIDILEDVPRQSDTLSLQKARKLYAMCMDVKELQTIGINALSRLIRKNGGWPMAMSLKEWKGKYQTWQQVSDILHKNMFSNGLFNIIVGVDDKKSDSHVITIMEPTFFAPRDIVIGIDQDPVQKAMYKSSIERVARVFVNDRGAYVDEATLDQDTRAVVDFEIELAKLAIPHEDRRDIDKLYNELTIEQLQRLYDAQRLSSKSKINWLKNLQILFAPEGIRIKPSEKLVVHAYNYLNDLIQLLDRTPDRTIVNYMQWTVIRSLLPYTDARLETVALQLAHDFQSQQIDDSRRKICAQRANLDTVISYEYIKRYTKQQTIEEVNNIITDVANFVHTQISTATWMDESTRKASLDKLVNMRRQVSAPDWYSDETIDKYYDGLTISSEYLESITNLFKYEGKRILRKLRKLVDKSDWGMEPTIVNAFHEPSGNAIILTAAILQDPIYDSNRPAYMNYGSIGFVIGHEINHGFDNQGRKYDKNGNFKQWWTQETIDRYEQLTQCFVDQYNSYEVPDLKDSDKIIYVNGQLSLGENIGDSAGIVAAFNAHKNRKARLNEPDIRLPGLEEYNNDQIFFMNAAHTFCENATPQQIQLLLLDEHARPEIRIRGSFSNFPEFSKAYNCPVGKEMNPEKKCILWH